MERVSGDEIRDVYRETARRYEMILRIYRILGVDLGKWRKNAFANLPDLEKPRILDVAVGTGANLPFLIEKYPDYESITGIDYTPEMLARGKKRIREHGWRDIDIGLVDAREMTSVLDGKFDLIISTYSLSIIPDSPQVLREIDSLLASNGYVMLLDCQKFKGLLRIMNPLAIVLSKQLGGNDETYSIPVSEIASSIFIPVRKKLLYSGLFYEDLYKKKSE